jgi:hypothetical protein
MPEGTRSGRERRERNALRKVGAMDETSSRQRSSTRSTCARSRSNCVNARVSRSPASPGPS